MKSSGIGGQAVIEGVMMKNKDQYAVAVRKPDKMIEVKVEKYHGIAEKHSIFKYPVLRGMGAFVESMVVGMKTLTYSASFYEEEEIKPSKLEETMGKVFKEKAESVVMGITVAVSIVAAVAIFMILPFFIAEFFKQAIDNRIVLALVEGLLRIGIFIAYIAAISQMQDIKRVFMYHGAEHKTINCVENGKELTVENVREQSRYHKRCGTSFLFIVMFISIIFFLFIHVDNVGLRMLFRVLLVPVIAGISYEFIRLAGRSDNIVVRILSKPGMWLQGMTTREPEDDMIEVAIQSVEAVFDWRAYQAEQKHTEESASILAGSEAAEAEAAEAEGKAAAAGNKAGKTEGKAAEAEVEAEKAENKAAAAETAVTEEKRRKRSKKSGKPKKEAASKQVAEEKKTLTGQESVKKAEVIRLEDIRAAKEKLEDDDGRKEKSAQITGIKAAKRAENSRTVREARKEREKQLSEEESREGRKQLEDSIPATSIARPDPDDDDDDILKALDKYFDED